MSITITLIDDKQRAQAILAIEKAIPRTRITISDPALTEAQLKLLRTLAADLMRQTPLIEHRMSEFERLLTAGMFCDQGAPGFEAGTFVVRGVQFEDLTVAQAGECVEYLYCYGAERGVIFRDKIS